MFEHGAASLYASPGTARSMGVSRAERSRESRESILTELSGDRLIQQLDGVPI